MVAADPREFAGLLPRLDAAQAAQLSLRWSVQGRLERTPVLLAAHGAGRANAALAVERACGRYPVRAVVSAGWCGALDQALELGEVVVASRVLSLTPRQDFPASAPGGAAIAGPVLTVDRFVQTREEKAALRSTGAVAVEMEAAGVAAEAQKRKLPFFCVRVVSDVAGESFDIDFNRARLADGRFSILRVLLEAGASPARWRELRELGRRDRLASGALGECLERYEFQN